MSRFLAVSAAILLASQAAFAGPVTGISVSGKLSGDKSLGVSCTVGKTGLISGTGSLTGKNTETGTEFSYPFYISKGSTAKGKLTLTGKMTAVNGPAVTITASVPSGAVTFSYVVNGKTYSMTGTGTVTTK